MSKVWFDCICHPRNRRVYLEDGTERRMTFCTACARKDADGTGRYEVITEEFIRTEIDWEMHDDSRTE
jgi:hypothetical protein